MNLLNRQNETEKDKLASVGEVVENKNKLPRNAKLVLRKGANHSQFGYLGKLLMDDSAEISIEEQLMMTIKYVSEFLNDSALAGNFREKSDSIL
ncbi:MAG TPA: alpha/beta hydrolase [Prolixibacteraceae bacterium]|nr:alpha/beta hydrolase [Prolixibacteraceae bacterium]